MHATKAAITIFRDIAFLLIYARFPDSSRHPITCLDDKQFFNLFLIYAIVTYGIKLTLSQPVPLRECHGERNGMPSRSQIISANPRFIAVILALIILVCAHKTGSKESPQFDKKREQLQRVIVLDGQFVHNVGKLQMNITNWGCFGSMPNSTYPMAESPSAQWPGGSGVEYLFAAGLWVGAMRNGVPVVSTGYPETEFHPPMDPVHTIYRTTEGAEGGTHYPSNPDDDRDGLIDEDWLNGLDDDGDGLIDEDFAAIGTQMFSCWYTDDQPVASSIWSEHTPMNIRVRQETYQWGEEGYDEFIGVRFIIENTGNDFLTNVYVGIFCDFDAGPRSRGTFHMDDMVGYYRGLRCAPLANEQVPVLLNVAYVYDDDGDNGQTPGYFGISFINYNRYGGGKYGSVLYPPRIGHYLTTFKIFRGLQQYYEGGEPINDYQRYDALSSMWQYDENTVVANDYKVLISMGPFWLTPYDMPITLDVAFVAGEGLEGMLESAAKATAQFRGCWVDADKNPDTGVNMRETPAIGPLEGHYPDPCNYPDLRVDVPAKDTCWSNFDCSQERREMTKCYHPYNSDIQLFLTGINGKEAHVPWIASTAPLPPKMRAVPGDNKVTLFWDNFSEIVPDPLTQRYDFEGYEIWRADGWHRPLGTSVLTGPEKKLWKLLEIGDLVNGISPDRDFKKPVREGGWIYEPILHLENREQLITMFEESLRYAPADTVPCPPDLHDKLCDTIEAIARHNLGLEGGKTFYQYIDTEVKNGMPLFYSVVAYDHKIEGFLPSERGRSLTPASSFTYVEPCSESQTVQEFEEREIYVVPNPVTADNMAPWQLGPNNDDPSGIKCELRNLPACRSTVRIFTLAGDLVQELYHDGTDGNGTVRWDLISRNGQDVASGVYLFSVHPEDGRFKRTVGKFVIIR